MLHKNRSTNKNQWKYALLIPLLTAFVFAFNTKTIAQEKEELIEVIEIQDNNLEVITSDSQKSDLEVIKNNLKSKGIDFSYSNLKFNNNNEIIKISVKIKNNISKASATWERKGSTIPTIFVGEDNGQAIASSSYRTNNKKHFSYTIHADEDAEIKKGKISKSNYVFVTSDGETKTWTSKDKDKQKIIVKEIHKGDKDHVWVKKGKKIKGDTLILKSNKIKIISEDDKEVIEVIEDSNDENIFIIKKDGEKSENHTIKVKKSEFITDDGVKIELNIDEDDASENIFIIEKDGKLIQEKREKNITVFNSEKEKPMIYVDDKLISYEAMKDIDPNSIESMSVLKGDNAIKKYGEKGKNGVILITTKKK